MTAHFIQYIDIDRYKCFSDFSAHGFQRVNLIAGKNNVGKTALMEAILLNVISTNVANFFLGLWAKSVNRKKIDYAFNNLNSEEISEHVISHADNLKTKTNAHFVSFESDSSGISKKFQVTIDDKKTILPSNEMNVFSIIKNRDKNNKTKAFWVSATGDSQAGIKTSFSAIQEKDRENDFNRFIGFFDNEIDKVKVIGDSIQCRVTAPDGTFSYRDISEYGDGLRHYISIITDLFTAENNYLFIDEIDSGIHYTSLDKLWDIILTLSKELNVQVFTTTHSRECIESYCRMVEKHKARDISFITLVKNKEKQIKAIVRDYDTFTDSIHDSREVRGW